MKFDLDIDKLPDTSFAMVIWPISFLLCLAVVVLWIPVYAYMWLGNWVIHHTWNRPNDH